MSSGRHEFSSNGRIAWMVAVATLAVILVLPVEAEAQDLPRKPPGAQFGAPAARASAPRSDSFDIVESARLASMAQSETQSEQQPLVQTAPGAIVCLAGCNTAPGGIVYEARPTIVAATQTVTQPELINAALNIATASRDMSPLTCLAGCGTPPAGRSVASLKQQYAKAAVPPTRQRAKPSIVDAPVVAAREDAPSNETSPPAKLRSAFAPNAINVSPKRLIDTRKRQAQQLGKAKVAKAGQPEYGKVLSVSNAKRPELVKSEPMKADEKTAAASPAPTPASEAAAPNSPPVTTFSPPKKPERKRDEKDRPVATVSTDWFNKIKNEQKAKGQ